MSVVVVRHGRGGGWEDPPEGTLLYRGPREGYHGPTGHVGTVDEESFYVVSLTMPWEAAVDRFKAAVEAAASVVTIPEDTIAEGVVRYGRSANWTPEGVRVTLWPDTLTTPEGVVLRYRGSGPGPVLHFGRHPVDDRVSVPATKRVTRFLCAPVPSQALPIPPWCYYQGDDPQGGVSTHRVLAEDYWAVVGVFS